jgi:hypothetical protein
LRPAFDFLFFGKGLTGFGLLIGTLYSSHTLFALIGCKNTNGGRAILAMEKGSPGDHAFTEAFAAWSRG